MGSDRDKIAEIEASGVQLDEKRWVTHTFGFTFNFEDALAAYEELGAFPFSVISEEGDDDNYVDIATFRKHRLTPAAIAQERAIMEAVATQHGGTYDGW